MHGIGGKTIAEAKQNLTYAEFIAWCRYRNKYGSLHFAMRMDRVISSVGAFFGSMFTRKGNKIPPNAFSVYDQAIEADEKQKAGPGTIEDAFAMLKSVSGKE